MLFIWLLLLLLLIIIIINSSSGSGGEGEFSVYDPSSCESYKRTSEKGLNFSGLSRSIELLHLTRRTLLNYIVGNTVDAIAVLVYHLIHFNRLCCSSSKNARNLSIFD